MSLRARPIALLALLVGMLALVAAGCGDDDSGGGGSAGGGGGEKKTYKIGVSNTLVGNGWREEMICSVKAQALASGQVSEVLVHNVNGDASAQITGIRNLISSGANANPRSRLACSSASRPPVKTSTVTSGRGKSCSNRRTASSRRSSTTSTIRSCSAAATAAR